MQKIIEMRDAKESVSARRSRRGWPGRTLPLAGDSRRR